MPPCFTQNFWPWYSSVLGIRLRTSRSTGLREGSISSLRWVNIFHPVKTRNAPKRYRTQANCSMRTAPPAMKIARKTSAPSTP